MIRHGGAKHVFPSDRYQQNPVISQSATKSNILVEQAPVLHPTEEEFENFEAYVKKIEETTNFLDVGVCKIIPPQGWQARKAGYALHQFDSFKIRAPSSQKFIPMKEGAFKLESTILDSMTFKVDSKELS